MYQCNVIYIYFGCNITSASTEALCCVVVFFKSATQIKFIVIKCSIFVDTMPLTCTVSVSCIVPHKHALCPTFNLLGSSQPSTNTVLLTLLMQTLLQFLICICNCTLLDAFISCCNHFTQSPADCLAALSNFLHHTWAQCAIQKNLWLSYHVALLNETQVCTLVGFLALNNKTFTASSLLHSRSYCTHALVCLSYFFVSFIEKKPFAFIKPVLVAVQPNL